MVGKVSREKLRRVWEEHVRVGPLNPKNRDISQRSNS